MLYNGQVKHEGVGKCIVVIAESMAKTKLNNSMLKKYLQLLAIFFVFCSMALLPTVVLAMDKQHGASGSNTELLSHLFWPIVNFSITVVILSWIYKKFLVKNLASHRNHVASELALTKSLLEDAQNLLTTTSNRLEGVELEASTILKEQALSGQRVGESLKVSANKSAEQIIRDTERQIEEELKRAEHQVRAGIIEKAVKDAEHLLKSQMTPELDREFRKQALDRLEC